MSFKTERKARVGNHKCHFSRTDPVPDTDTAGVGTNQFHAHQGNVVTFVIIKIIHDFNGGSGGHFIEVQLALMLPVHPKNEALPHMRKDAVYVIRPQRTAQFN